MDTSTFVLLAAFILAFGLISGRLHKSVITPPMIFVTFGLLIGPVALGVIRLDFQSNVIHILAEATLIRVFHGSNNNCLLGRAVRDSYRRGRFNGASFR